LLRNSANRFVIGTSVPLNPFGFLAVLLIEWLQAVGVAVESFLKFILLIYPDISCCTVAVAHVDH
jgi:hypothetical protein